MATTKPPKRFIAIDGESVTVNGEHRYILLMSSDYEYIHMPEGIPTKRCFEFLLSLPKDTIPVAFGLNYDVNMMLRDFGRKRLEALWTEGKTSWFDYDIEWIPGKWFRITHNGLNRKRRTVKVNETFGFFQSSFIKALEKWKIDYQNPDELETMKGARSTFDSAMVERIIDYCHTECELLVRLMDGLRTALLDVDIELTSWNGAGSVAATLLRKHGVKVHHKPHTELPPHVQEQSLHAYFGGRTELFQQGSFPLITEYDICSAYPYAAQFLPSMAKGRWRRVKHYQPHKPHAIYHVSWDLPPETVVAPFPYRYAGSRISYPLNGSGYYHAIEVKAALDAYPNHITIHSGITYTPSDDVANPFEFIQELYEYRRELKAQAHAGEKCIKLGINSVYGKLAQGTGYRDSLPPFQSYFWAGEITARTRSTVFTIARLHPRDIVMVATDAVFLRGAHDLPVGTALGDLERVDLDQAFTAQPGVYRARSDGKDIKRSRGFFAKDIDFDALAKGFHDMGPDYIGHYKSTRFHGLGTSLMSRDMDKWRTWITAERKLSLYPSTKVIRDPDARPVHHTPPRVRDPFVPSAPYRMKLRGYRDNNEEYTAGAEQPLRS